MRRKPTKTPSPSVQRYRGPNHVLISRRSSHTALRARLRKLLDSGKWNEVHVHGLGAALAPAIALAAELVQESDGRLEVSAGTSTEALIDQLDEAELDEDGDGSTAAVRHNSAIHIRLRLTS